MIGRRITHQKFVRSRYSYDATIGPNNTYTLTFDRTRGDSIRIMGWPEGRSRLTSIGELEAFYRG